MTINLGGFRPHPKPEKKIKEPGKLKAKSDKLKKLELTYAKRAKEFIQGKMCAVYPDRRATEVHHMAGRVGFADDFARLNNTPLLLDERYWLPVSREAHRKITDESAWAIENGFSVRRNIKR
jgi:hypothetical protein